MYNAWVLTPRSLKSLLKCNSWRMCFSHRSVEVSYICRQLFFRLWNQKIFSWEGVLKSFCLTSAKSRATFRARLLCFRPSVGFWKSPKYTTVSLSNVSRWLTTSLWTFLLPDDPWLQLLTSCAPLRKILIHLHCSFSQFCCQIVQRDSPLRPLSSTLNKIRSFCFFLYAVYSTPLVTLLVLY